MKKIKTICSVLAIETAVIGLVLSAKTYGHRRYYQGYTDGLLKGASEVLNTSNN